MLGTVHALSGSTTAPVPTYSIEVSFYNMQIRQSFRTGGSFISHLKDAPAKKPCSLPRRAYLGPETLHLSAL